MEKPEEEEQLSASEVEPQPSLVEGDFFPLLDSDDDVASPTRPLPTPAPVVFRGTKKKVSWAKDGLLSTAAFFLPQSGRSAYSSRPVPVSGAAATATAPTIIFKERRNVDGTPYLFFPSQRLSSRWLEVRAAGKGLVHAPFTNQPGDAMPCTSLLACLFPTTPRMQSGTAGGRRHAVFTGGLYVAPAEIPKEIVS